jgi:hypothetical protein
VKTRWLGVIPHRSLNESQAGASSVHERDFEERQPGVWELRVRTGRDPMRGTNGQVSRTFKGRKRQAEVALARLSVEVEDGNHRGAGHTVGSLLDAWTDHLEVLGRTAKTIDRSARWRVQGWRQRSVPSSCGSSRRRCWTASVVRCWPMGFRRRPCLALL